MVLNIQGNQTKPETTIGRFGLEEKDPTVGIDLPEGLLNDYFKTVQSSSDGSYPELPKETSTTEPITEPSTTSQTEKLFGKRPKLRPPKPTIRPKRRPGSVSPIDKIAELNYLLEGKLDPKSKKSQILSGLSSLTENGRKAVQGFFDNAAGGESGLDPAKDYWCAAFVAHVLSELGADPLNPKAKPGSTERYDRLRADKYRNYGSEVKSLADAKEGDIIVFDMRGNDGIGDHVAFYAGDRITPQGGIDPLTGEKYINVVGGNQGAYNEVNIRENLPEYTMNNVVAIRRITYNDIDFDFTKEMAKQDPVFNKFIPKYASMSLLYDPDDDDTYPSFDEGGLAQDDQMGILGFSAQGVQQEVDKYVDKDAEPAKDITFKDAAKFVAELTPIIGDAMAAKEVYDELQKDDPNYFLAGALGGAAIIGLIPGIGDAAASAIRAGARKALDVGKRIEVDPDAVGMMGGNIKLTLEAPSKSKPSYTDAELLEADDIIDEWGKGNLTNVELRNQMRDKGFAIETKRISPKMTGDDLEVVGPDGNIIPWKDMPRGTSSARPANYAEDLAEAERLIDNPDALKAWIEKEGGKGKRQENPADSEAAAQALIEGSITSKEARKRIGDAIPPPKEYTADEVRNMMPTVTDVTGAMGKKARDYGILGVKGFDLELKKGQLIGTRLDIPAYNKYDKWVVSIHDGGTKEKINLKGSVLGYGQAIRLKNVRFGSDATIALDIARGIRTDQKTLQDAIDKKTGGPAKQNKATIARAVGEYVPQDPYELQEMAASIIESGSKEWTQVGMNPYRGSQFYDKKTGKIIFDADEMIQVGPLVLAKNAKVATISDLKEMAVRTKDGKLRMFSEGGTAMKDQMQMAFKDDGMTKDPVSGNDIPPGSLAKEVRDDIPAMLSEGEYVVPADVLRYYGVNFFENLRNQAKSGLQNMEATGRIGGEPLSPDQVQQNMSGQRMAGAPPVQPVAANNGPMMLGQQSQTGANTATTGQPVQNTFTPMNFSTVGFSQYQQPTQKPTSVTTTKTYVNANNTSDTRIVTYVDGVVTPPADVKYTQPPYYLQGSAGLAEAIKGAPQGGGGGGGGGGAPDPKPKDPNAWAKNITNPEEWAEENLQGKANNLINTIKLGTSVARVNAMAELAKAQGNMDLYNSLSNKAKEFVADNPLLNSLPNAWIDGDKIAADLQKDKDLVNSIFSIKDKKVVSSDPRDPANLSPNQLTPKVSTTAEKDDKGKTNITSDKKSSKAAGTALENLKKNKDSYIKSSTDPVQTAKNVSDLEKSLSASSQNPSGTMSLNKGGLMQRKKKKGK